MIKRIFAPVQAWILMQGKCVGCGKNLSLGRRYEAGGNAQKVVCACGRIFIFDRSRGKYRRAHATET